MKRARTLCRVQQPQSLFEPMGCDGSRIECPRAAEREARVGPAGKKDAAPTVWVTAFVHLGTGLLWSWQLGLGNADERLHMRQLLAKLSLHPPPATPRDPRQPVRTWDRHGRDGSYCGVHPEPCI